MKPLIPTAENGLFSRQLFYYMPAIHKWQNQFDRQDTDLETVFTGLGMQWREQLKRITAGGLFTLRLTPEQKELFNNLFANLFIRSHLANGSEMASSVARLAINICRIMQVVAMLRVLESDDIARSPHLTPDKDISGDNLKDGIITRWDMTILPPTSTPCWSLPKASTATPRTSSPSCPEPKSAAEATPTATPCCKAWKGSLHALPSCCRPKQRALNPERHPHGSNAW